MRAFVTEMFPSRGYWVLMAQASPLFAPKRLFASADDERRFVAEALSRMSEASRARSKEAVAFAAWE